MNNDKESTINLTFDEVYLLGREIIENINPMYLEEYDKLITSGKLDFSYNQEYFDNHYAFSSDAEIEEININIQHNYRDVMALAHEFIHMTKFNKNITSTKNVLTEFISIYFEEYARNYLLKKGIPKEQLYFNDRIISTKNTANSFNWYALIMLVYEKIGNIDENSYLFLREYYLPITKEVFEEECKFLLDKFKKTEEDYKLEVMYEKEYDDDKLYNRCASLLNSGYKYIFGTLLAYYALDNVDKEKMVWLNEHVDDEDKTVYDMLSQVGIELDEIPLANLVEIVESKIDLDNEKTR